MITVNSKKLVVESTSKGNQRKWYQGNLFIKEDYLGYEGIAECVVSTLLSCIEIPYGFSLWIILSVRY